MTPYYESSSPVRHSKVLNFPYFMLALSPGSSYEVGETTAITLHPSTRPTRTLASSIKPEETSMLLPNTLTLFGPTMLIREMV